MLIEALASQEARLVALLPALRNALEWLDDPGVLSLPQALLLAAAVLETKPQVVLDLGTGSGNSAATFGLAGHDIGTKVYTFDLYYSWVEALKPKLAPELQNRLDEVVTPVVGDITEYDFAPIIGSAECVVVFWDAHGYPIAERVLGHLMPIIADRWHLVICHDMTDSRFLMPGSYEGKSFWRGTDGAHWNDAYPHATIGPITTRVEQAVPIMDFCWRNGIKLHSLDWQLHRTPEVTVSPETFPKLGLDPQSMLHMMYFSMNETRHRFFPGQP